MKIDDTDNSKKRITFDDEEGGEEEGGRGSELKLWGLGSTWRQLPRIKSIMFWKPATGVNYSIFAS